MVQHTEMIQAVGSRILGIVGNGVLDGGMHQWGIYW